MSYYRVGRVLAGRSLYPLLNKDLSIISHPGGSVFTPDVPFKKNKYGAPTGGCEKTLLWRIKLVRILALKTPNQGLDCSYCCWVAWPRLTQKECFFTDTGRALGLDKVLAVELRYTIQAIM